MKRIKSIAQLQLEKRRIKRHQLQLEQSMRLQWAELKTSLKPASIAGNAFSNLITNKTLVNLATDGIVKTAVTVGVGLLAQKLAGQTDSKILTFFKKKK